MFCPFKFCLILQLINGISSDLEKLFRYFNGTAIVAFFSIPKIFRILEFHHLDLEPVELLFHNNLNCILTNYINITKSESSASSTLVLSIFVIHLANCTQFLKSHLSSIIIYNSNIASYYNVSII